MSVRWWGPTVREDAAGEARRRPRLRIVALALLGAAMAKVLLGGVVASLMGFSMEEAPVGVVTAALDNPPAAAGDTLAATVAHLQRALAARVPRRPWIVIDRANNRLWVRGREGVIMEAVVSTGSGAVLHERQGKDHIGRSWTFDTPPGRFRVLAKRRNPVWVKPDWAFLEEGQRPPASLVERRDSGALGAWALDLGDGYMIHGTLYERLLGRSITHGCVRVGGDDLERLVSLTDRGTSVFIF